jgi:predicted phage terminase large subunit-like protein
MCNQFKVDTLLVESKASGLSVAQEIKRLNRNNTWSVQLINPGNADKVARAYAVQASFSNSQIWSPDRDWADKVITQCEVFPKGKHDDAVDSTTQAIRYLRERGFLTRQEDILAGASARASYKKPSKPLYDI